MKVEFGAINIGTDGVGLLEFGGKESPGGPDLLDAPMEVVSVASGLP